MIRRSGRIVQKRRPRRRMTGYNVVFHPEVSRMDNALKADLLVMVHFAFVLFVVIGQLYIWVGLAAGWPLARNFWFGMIHLASILVVAARAIVGVVPVPAAERGRLEEEPADWRYDMADCP